MRTRHFVLSSLLVLLALPASAGFHYVAETTVDGKDDTGAMKVEAWVDGDRAKVVFTESKNPMMGAGSFLLTEDGGKTLYLVNPEEGTYSVWDLEAMLESLGGVMNAVSGVMNIEVTEPVVEKLLEEDGGRIHGYPTTHYRYRTAYTMQMKVMGMKRGDRFESVQDIWSTTVINDAAFTVWLRNAPKSTGYDSFDKLAEAEYSKLSGFPLKTIDRTTTTGVKKSGRSNTTTTSMTVTLLEEQSVADRMFELDPALEEVPLMPLPGVMPAEEPTDEPQEEEEEEEGGRFKKLRKKLRG